MTRTVAPSGRDGTVGGTAPGGKPRRGGERARNLIGVAVWATLIIGGWWLAIEITNPDVIVASSPADVFRELAENPGDYVQATLETLRTAGIGLVLGVILGSILAIVGWWSVVLGGLVELPALFLRSVPIIAVIPVTASVVGYGPRTTLLIAGIISFFPTYALVDSGLRNIPPGSDDVFRVVGSSRWTRLLYLAVPSAVPNATTALRLSVTIAILGGMATEYITGVGGLGELFANSRLTYSHPARGWTVAVITAGMSFVAFALVSSLHRRARERFSAF